MINPDFQSYIIKLIERIGIFKSELQPGLYELMSDFELALYIAGRKGRRRHFDNHDKTRNILEWEGLCEDVFVDIKKEWMKYFDGLTIQENMVIEGNFTLNCSLIFDALKRRPPFNSRELLDECYEDMVILLLHLHIGRNKRTSFCNLMRDAYEAGGWPCGWRGTEQDGKMIVYWPHGKIEGKAE